MRNLIILATILLVSCGEPTTQTIYVAPDTSDVINDSQFDKYKVDFEDLTGAPTSHIKIMLDYNVDMKTAATCYSFENHSESNYIIVNAQIWYGIKDQDLSKKALMLHELTHCALFVREHYNEMLEDGCPVSVMHYRMTSEQCYRDHMPDYIEGVVNLAAGV